MKKMTKIFGLLLLAALMIQCREDEEITPMTPDPTDETPLATDTVSVGGDAAEAEKFSFVGEVKNETNNGFEVKGGMYIDTDSGKVAIVKNAEFAVSYDLEGNMKSMEGTGPAQLPDLGMFKNFILKDATEAAFVYNTGKFFKDNNQDFKELPLRDTSYYFFFNLVNLATGEKEDMSVKNAKLGITSYFVNIPQQEIIIPTGTFEINTPQGSISVGNDLAIGISAKKSFPFTPQQYADTSLNKVIDEQKAFSDLSGFLYLKGEMSLGKKIPMKISGDAVLDGDLDIVFTEGFASSSYSFAMNGNLLFGHDLLDLIPVDFETKLTNVTLRLDESQIGTERQSVFKFAGEFDDNAWMETVVDKIAGTNISQYIPFTGNEGSMFASFGDNWEFYVNTYFAINTPHLGKQPTRKGTLHITEEQLGISGALAIPFMPGELAARGTFGYDGNIHLEAKGNSEIEIEGVKMDANLDFDIYNDKATLVGNINVPYGLGTVDIDGIIDSEGLTFSGYAGNKNLEFQNNLVIPVGGLSIYANLRETNPEFSLSGSMFLPQMDQPLVDVSGTINSKGLEFKGLINTNLRLQKFTLPMTIPMVNVSLTARTWEGVYFNGSANLPFGLAGASIDGYIAAGKKDLGGFPEIFLDANFSANPNLIVEGFSFPTAGLDLTISSVDGITFDGSIRLGKYFGYLASSGTISGNKLDFSASYNNYLNYSGRSLYTSVNFNAGSHRYPDIGSMSGEVFTPFGKVSVSGVLGLNGNFALSGQFSDCSTVENPFNTFSAKYYKKFSFSQSGVSLSASGYLCDNKCEEAKDCVSKSVSTDISWADGRFKVCIPIPVIGDHCF